MREETTTLLQPSARRKETGFCSDWTERSIASWRPFTGLSGLHHSQTQTTWNLGLLCYIKRYHDGGLFSELKTLLFQANRCSEMSSRVYITYIELQWFISNVLCGWMKEKIQGNRNIGEILKHLYGAALLMVFCKAVLKYSMSIKTHTHTALKSTHILLTFQLPVHANLSISD